MRIWSALIVGGSAAAALLIAAGPGVAERHAPEPAQDRPVDLAINESARGS